MAGSSVYAAAPLPPTATAAVKALLLPLYVPCFFDSMAMGIIGPTLPLFALSLGASEGVTGIVVSTVALGRLSFSVPGGQLVGRIGEKRAIQLGLMVRSPPAPPPPPPSPAACAQVYTCSSVLLALAPSVPLVMLARLLAGGGQQATGVGRQAFCAAAVATHHRGRLVGLLGGVSRIGGIAGPLIGGLTAQLYGFRAAFMLQAALNALGVLLVQLAMPSPEGGGGGGRGSANKKTGAGCFDIIGEFWHSLLVSQKRRACMHVFQTRGSIEMSCHTTGVRILRAAAVLLACGARAHHTPGWRAAGALRLAGCAGDRGGRKW